MSDQFYRVVTTYTSDEWPFPMDDNEWFHELNYVLPPSYHFAVVSGEEGVVVELYEYVGEADEADVDEVMA